MIKYLIATTRRFDKDYAKLDASTQALVDNVLDTLASGNKLEPKYHDHALKGKLAGLRDCHIKPDLVLIYELDKDILILTALRVGSHSELRLNK